jgi:hypothetical protein
VHGGAPEKPHVKALFQPGREAWNGRPAFDPKFMRAMQRSEEIAAAQWRGDVSALKQAAALTHRAFEEFLQNIDCFGTPDRHQQAAVMNGNTGERRDFRPYVPRAARTAPGVVFGLPGDGDETEIANAGPIGLRVTVEHRYLEASPSRMQGMGQADDTGANDQKVKFLFHASIPRARSHQGTKPEVILLSIGFGTIHPAILSAQGRDLNLLSKTSKIGPNRQVIKIPKNIAAEG